MTDFSNIKIRCSSLGSLMTEPQSKTDKDAGNLSKTAQKHLIDVYIAEKYGRIRDIQTKQIAKGIEAEQASIELLSLYLKKPFNKNEERISNEYVSGLPDLYNGNDIKNTDLIIDIKSSYDLWTFMANVPDKLDSIYYWQLMGYMWLTGATNSYVAYCLVNTPDNIIQKEKYWMLQKMNVVSEESPEFIRESAKIEFNMTFDDISIAERVLLFPVKRNEDDIFRIQNKVEKAREFLIELENTHLNFNNERF